MEARNDSPQSRNVLAEYWFRSVACEHMHAFCMRWLPQHAGWRHAGAVTSPISFTESDAESDVASTATSIALVLGLGVLRPWLTVSGLAFLECFALTADTVGFFGVWIGMRAVAAVSSMQRLRMAANAHFIWLHSGPRVKENAHQEGLHVSTDMPFTMHCVRTRPEPSFWPNIPI